MNETTIINTDCAIVGGGPAGIMLGYLLARKGIDVTVLEKWPDFFRDFRGDTIHPSTMDTLFELGILDEFLALPHNETRKLIAHIGDAEITIADLTHLKTHCKFIAFIPQWDFLDFLVTKAKQFPSFHLLMETEGIDVRKDNDRIIGLIAKSKGAACKIHSPLVVAADGRHSTMREKAGMVSIKFSAPMDVLWFRLSRKQNDPETSLGRANYGKFIVLIDRDAYWQCGFIIQKGTRDTLQQEGLESFHANVIAVAPFLEDRVTEISNWDQVKLLSVTVERLNKWYTDGLLCIGDAAHAMSPIGGVGINYAIQDAVAAANILIPNIRAKAITISDLQRVQKRREKPTRRMQVIQVFIQNHVIKRLFEDEKPTKLPWIVRLLFSIPGVNRIPAHIIGVGFQQEHIIETK